MYLQFAVVGCARRDELYAFLPASRIKRLAVLVAEFFDAIQQNQRKRIWAGKRHIDAERQLFAF